MDVQTDVINAQQKISGVIIDKTKESFTVAASTDKNNNNRLGIQLKNLGTNPVTVENIWIINNSGSFPAQKHLLDYSDANIPSGYGVDILENKPLYMTPDDYDIKVVSNLGTVKKLKLEVGGYNNLRASMIAIPPDVKVGENVTLGLHVENIGNSRLLGVAPAGDYPNIVPPFTSPVPAVPAPVDLNPGESVFFFWKYEVTGSVGTLVNFDNYVNATEEDTGFVVDSNVATTVIELREPDESEIIVLTQDLLAKPEIFVVLPGPFGDDAEQALWAVNIVNPTPKNIEVNKITFTVLSARLSGTDKIFNEQSCSPTTLPITPAGTWTCPVMNQLMWKNLASPAVVDPYSVLPFAVKMDAGSLSGGPTDVLEVIPTQVDVFTTLGQFGKAGYGTSMDNGGSALANVYLTDVPRSTAPANILTNVTGIPPGTPIKLNATLADFDTGSSKEIDEDSRLIINIPRGWTSPTVLNAPAFTILPIQTYSDGSSQIVGVLDNELTGSGGIAETIEFQITSPVVTSTQLYVMYVLADGTADDGNMALGPLAEIILQVRP